VTRPIRSIAIGERQVGPPHPCYVIAEIGVNHNGSVAIAKDLILAAKRAGADCAKFQTFRADKLATLSAVKAPYQQRTTGSGESQLEMLRRLELSRDAQRELIAFCATQRIEFMSTPYGEDDARLLADLGVFAFKIPSALIVEPEFLRTVAGFGKPIILSTGMATLSEVQEAVQVIAGAGDPGLVLLQCTTDYPTRVEDANVRVMQTFAKLFAVPVGFSDHTRTATAAIVAASLGASVIEKHLTLDKSLEGPDHAASADPGEFEALVAAIREAEQALGRSEKEPTAAERENMVVMRRSVVARSTIPAGAVVETDMVTTKRPATGIPPRDLARVVGARARVEILADSPLEWWMLERVDDH
jgi:N-acetylneuraminate synthase/N,N'-diacetyllegionaminate synthase